MDPKDEDDGTTRVHVCAGPPWCSLEDREAVAAQIAGCVWCTVYAYHPDGTESIKKPSRAKNRAGQRRKSVKGPSSQRSL